MPGTAATTSKSGWSNSKVFRFFLKKHFFKFAKPTADEPVLLIYNGHKSHVNIAISDWATANNIHLFLLPAHTAHFLQPIDVACFGPLESLFSSSKHDLMKSDKKELLSKREVCTLACKAYQEGLNTINLVSGFSKTGVFPMVGIEAIPADTMFTPSIPFDPTHERSEETTEVEETQATATQVDIDMAPGKVEAARRAKRLRENKEKRERIIKEAVNVIQTGTTIEKAAKDYNIREETLRRRMIVSKMDPGISSAAAKRAKRIKERVNKEKAIKDALQEIQDGAPMLKTAKKYNISDKTLQRRRRLEVNYPFCYNKTFNEEEENVLAKHCIMMESLGYRFASWQIIQMAKDMAESSGVKRAPTHHWLSLFLERFPKIKMEKICKKRKDDTTDEPTDETVDRYFSYLEPLLEDLNIKNAAQFIWHVDEIGISLDLDPPRVLTDAKEKSYHIAPGKFQTMSLTAAVSALGETIPPFLTFKGEEITPAMREGVPPGTVFKSSVDGWSTYSIFQSFFFNHLLKHIKIRPLLILYDGHVTHYSTEVIHKASEDNVHLVVLPPHRRKTYQSSDVSIFSPFTELLSTNVKKIKQPTDSTTIDELPGIICSSFKKAMSKPAIMSGFEKCGILPLNKDAIARKTTAGGENLQIDSLVDFKITTFELS